MSKKKIIGVTVGTPTNPQKVVEKSGLKKQVEQNTKDISGLSGQIADMGKGLTQAQITALDNMFKVSAYDSEKDYSDAYIRFKQAFGIDVVSIPCTEVTLNKSTLSFTDSTSQTLTATVTPSNTTDTVVWTCSNNAIATVSNGVVKPLSNGSATITATCGSKSATCSVSVNIAEEITLESISVTYIGEEVTVGTALTELTGITVTAHYSDGSTSNVTGYTLSGTIAEGTNTITVSYGGKTTTFTVTGVVESGGDEPDNPETGVSNKVTWTDGVAYTYEAVFNEYVEKDGKITPYTSWDRTPYLYCNGASTLRFTVKKETTMLSTNNFYNCFFDVNKNFINSFNYNGIDGGTIGSYVDVTIPTNAVYFIASHKGGVVSDSGNGSLLEITPYE